MTIQFETITKEDFDNKKIKSIDNVQSDKNTKDTFSLGELLLKNNKTMEQILLSIDKDESLFDIKGISFSNFELLKSILSNPQCKKTVGLDIKEEFKEYSKYDRTLELKDLHLLSNKFYLVKEKLYGLIVSLFTSMYQGVLIPDKISIRNNQIYPFRCQSRYADDTFFHILHDNHAKEEIFKVFKKEDQIIIIKELFDVLKFFEDNKSVLDIQDIDIDLNTPYLFIDQESEDVNFRLVNRIVISSGIINFYGVDLVKHIQRYDKEFIKNESLYEGNICNQEEIRNSSCSYNITLSEKMYCEFLNNFGEYILNIAKEYEKLYINNIDIIERSLQHIQKIGSKYLIANRLIQDNSQ